MSNRRKREWYDGVAKERLIWPPKNLPHFTDRPVRKQALRDYEPWLRKLTRYYGDKAMTTNTVETCCDCGLKHFSLYQVFQAPNKEFYLQIRKTADDTTGLRGKRARRKK